MDGNEAMEFLRYLKKPISEIELQNFYKLFKREVARQNEELLAKYDTLLDRFIKEIDNILNKYADFMNETDVSELVQLRDIVSEEFRRKK